MSANVRIENNEAIITKSIVFVSAVAMVYNKLISVCAHISPRRFARTIRRREHNIIELRRAIRTVLYTKSRDERIEFYKSVHEDLRVFAKAYMITTAILSSILAILLCFMFAVGNYIIEDYKSRPVCGAGANPNNSYRIAHTEENRAHYSINPPIYYVCTKTNDDGTKTEVGFWSDDDAARGEDPVWTQTYQSSK